MGTSHDLYIARQPICDADGRLIAYELLYRSGDTDRANVTDPDLATAQVLVTTFLELGLDSLVRGKPAFVNVSRPFFAGDLGLPVTPDQVILEVLEDIVIEPALVEGVRRLAAEGYQIVLDDFQYTLESEPLLEIVHGVKLDMLNLDAQAFREHVALAHASELNIIAERVETYSQLRQAAELGCHAFQGFYFARPELVSGRALPNNQAVLLTLLSRLQNPDLTMDELERLVVQDISLTYRLLRYANCAAFALRRQVESVRDAILLLGSRLIQQWAVLLIVARFGDNHPEPLLDSSLLRARMCESLVERFEIATPSEGFTVGLFSTLDALLGVPMPELVDQVTLTPQARQALVSGEAPLGRLLHAIIAYEQAQWDVVPESELPAFREAYLEAARWCDQTRSLLQQTQ